MKKQYMNPVCVVIKCNSDIVTTSYGDTKTIDEFSGDIKNEVGFGNQRLSGEEELLAPTRGGRW